MKMRKTGSGAVCTDCSSGTGRPTNRQSSGFTLVELVAVVVTAALLVTIFMTGVGATRPHTYTFQCLNNLRQMASGWKMYADENRGNLVFNPFAIASSSAPAWVGGTMGYNSGSDNTNVDLLVNNQKYPYCGFLGPYVKSASLFKCPADKSVYSVGGQQIPRVRSVSMNNFVGTGARSFFNTTKYRIYSRIEQVRLPASLFLIMDEREDSINEGVFLTDPDTPYRLFDYPANYHDGSANVVFMDGHAELHKWQDSRTTPPLCLGSWPPSGIAAGDIDVDWIDQHTSELR